MKKPFTASEALSKWGKLGGKATTLSKIKASRKNGGLGGRPPKKSVALKKPKP